MTRRRPASGSLFGYRPRPQSRKKARIFLSQALVNLYALGYAGRPVFPPV